MQTWERIEQSSQKFQGGSVTMGNFDGVHLGHQSLLEKAREQGGPVILITFDPHPMQVLHPEKPLIRIFSREDLKEQLPKFGVDLLLMLKFTPEMAATSAEDFWRKYVSAPFKPKHVIAGHDFAFGRGREGSLEFLDRWSKSNGAQVHVMPALQINGETVSSRVIREKIKNGRVTEAARLLGRRFYLRGKVGTGAGRGKAIGVPTLNFEPVKEIVPAQGVYATRTRWQGNWLPSVTNIGVNPTFGGNEGLKIETHVLKGAIEARGEVLDVEFVERLRPEMKFASIEDLKKQIKSDILKANEALDKLKPNE